MLHQQLYKCSMDEVLVQASLHSNVQSASVRPVRVCVHDIHPKCAMVDHLRVEDNLLSASLAEDVPPRSIIEMKDVEAAGQHPRIKDSIQLFSLFLPKPKCDVRRQIPQLVHSHEVVPVQWASSVQRELETKSLGSLHPLRWSKSPCATCNGHGSILVRDHITRQTSSSVCWKKRKGNESFLDWFCW